MINAKSILDPKITILPQKQEDTTIKPNRMSSCLLFHQCQIFGWNVRALILLYFSSLPSGVLLLQNTINKSEVDFPPFNKTTSQNQNRDHSHQIVFHVSKTDHPSSSGARKPSTLHTKLGDVVSHNFSDNKNCIKIHN